MHSRWEGDDSGRGVGDARRHTDGLEELGRSMRLPGWVAEDPEVHLLPHIMRLCKRQKGLTYGDSHIDGHILVIRLEWSGDRHSGRSAIYAVIGAFAEPATMIRERRENLSRIFEVTTGTLHADSPYTPHGHMVRLIVEI